MRRHIDSPATDRQTRVNAPFAQADPDRVAAVIVRVARRDRRILEALAAFDRGDRPAA